MNAKTPSEEPLLEKALSFDSTEARQAYLEGACGADDALRARLEALVAAHEDAGGPPAVQPTVAASTLPMEPQFDERPGTVIGRYKLLQPIGEGGMGVVYMAEQEEPVRRRVALKIIKLGMDTKSVIARFEAERQALAMMDHPNIAKVLDGGTTETGRPYFVMELVRGIKITDYCDQNHLSPWERLGLFVQVCHAIQHAHQKGIIHRDIKPSNILVSLHDGEPVPVVIDFGIAKATEQRLTDKTLFTAFEQFMGTPAYTSPEQAEMSRLDIDTRSDIYSLGVLLYELLTGKTPFDTRELLAAGLEGMRRTIREQDPARPSTRLSTMLADELTTTAKRRQVEPPKLIELLRGDLDWIVMKCLEKDRTRRYETASGLAEDVQRHLNREPVAARPPSTIYRLEKAWQRNKVGILATATVVAALLLGTGISTWQALVATRAKSDADAALRESQRAGQSEKQARQRADAQRIEATHNLYLADMSLAQQAWEENNQQQLRQLLKDTQDSPYRGFEWYYWQKQTHLAARTLRGHLDTVFAVWSPDGQHILTSSSDGTTRIWETATGRQLSVLERRSLWTMAAYCPDGQRVVTCSADRTAKVWDAVSGRELLSVKWPGSIIRCLAVSPDGQRVAMGSRGRIGVWEIAGTRELRTFNVNTGEVDTVAFSPDGQRIVSATSSDVPGRVWDATSGRELLTLGGYNDYLGAAVFSPDGRRILAASGDKQAKVWDAVTGKELLTLEAHGSAVSCVAYSPDGQLIATGSGDSTVRVWGAASGRERLVLRGHSGTVISVAFSPDARRIVTGSDDMTAKLWDVSPVPLLPTAVGPANGYVTVALSPDGQRIVTGSEGDLFGPGIPNGPAKVWEVASGRQLAVLSSHRGCVDAAAFSPDGQRIVTGSRDKTAKVWNATNGEEICTLQGHRDSVQAVAFSPDGQRIVTGIRDKTARVWDLPSGRQVFVLRGHKDNVWFVAYSPDGKQILTGSLAEGIVWEAPSGRQLFTLNGHRSWVDAAACSPDGQRIVSGDDSGMAKVWDATNGRELFKLEGHSSGAITWVAFSPDSRRIVTGSRDKTAKIWEVASGRELLTLKGATERLAWVGFSPDGSKVIAGGVDKAVRVWESATAGQVTTWQEEERLAAESIAAEKSQRESERERRRLACLNESLRHWLVLGPIPLDPARGPGENLANETVKDEACLMPKAGEQLAVGSRELQWREARLSDAAKGFAGLMGDVTGDYLAYAVCYLKSDVDQRELKLLVGRDAVARIYLNTRAVYQDSGMGSGGRILMPPDITLDAGLNLLVLKVLPGGWVRDGSICLTDAQGNPVKGITMIVDPTPSEQMELSRKLAPLHAELRRQRGLIEAKFGHWKEATTELTRALRSNPEENWNWYQLAPLLVEQNDLTAYHNHSKAMMSRFKDTTDPPVAERAAKAALLLPGACPNLELACTLAERAVTLGRGQTWEAYYQFTRGLAEYRRGRYTNAIAGAQFVLDSSWRDPALDAQADLVLAMARHQLNAPAEARATLARGADIVAHALPQLDGPDLGDNWHDVLIANLLLREAKQLIGDPPVEGNPTNRNPSAPDLKAQAKPGNNQP